MAVTVSGGNVQTPSIAASFAATHPNLLAFEGTSDEGAWLRMLRFGVDSALAAGEAAGNAVGSFGQAVGQFVKANGTTVGKLFQDGLKASGVARMVHELQRAGVLSAGKSEFENARALQKAFGGAVTASQTEQLIGFMRSGKPAAANRGAKGPQRSPAPKTASTKPFQPALNSRQGVIDKAITGSTLTGAQGRKVNTALLHLMAQLGIAADNPKGAMLFVAAMNGDTSRLALALLRRAHVRNGGELTHRVYQLAGLMPAAQRARPAARETVAQRATPSAHRTGLVGSHAAAATRRPSQPEQTVNKFAQGSGGFLDPKLGRELGPNRLNERRGAGVDQLPQVTRFPKTGIAREINSSQPFPGPGASSVTARYPHTGSSRQAKSPFPEGASTAVDARRRGTVMASDGAALPSDEKARRRAFGAQALPDAIANSTRAAQQFRDALPPWPQGLRTVVQSPEWQAMRRYWQTSGADPATLEISLHTHPAILKTLAESEALRVRAACHPQALADILIAGEDNSQVLQTRLPSATAPSDLARRVAVPASDLAGAKHIAASFGIELVTNPDDDPGDRKLVALVNDLTPTWLRLEEARPNLLHEIGLTVERGSGAWGWVRDRNDDLINMDVDQIDADWPSISTRMRWPLAPTVPSDQPSRSAMVGSVFIHEFGHVIENVAPTVPALLREVVDQLPNDAQGSTQRFRAWASEVISVYADGDPGSPDRLRDREAFAETVAHTLAEPSYQTARPVDKPATVNLFVESALRAKQGQEVWITPLLKSRFASVFEAHDKFLEGFDAAALRSELDTFRQALGEAIRPLRDTSVVRAFDSAVAAHKTLDAYEAGQIDAARASGALTSALWAIDGESTGAFSQAVAQEGARLIRRFPQLDRLAQALESASPDRLPGGGLARVRKMQQDAIVRRLPDDLTDLAERSMFGVPAVVTKALTRGSRYAAPAWAPALGEVERPMRDLIDRAKRLIPGFVPPSSIHRQPESSDLPTSRSAPQVPANRAQAPAGQDRR